MAVSKRQRSKKSRGKARKNHKDDYFDQRLAEVTHEVARLTQEGEYGRAIEKGKGAVALARHSTNYAAKVVAATTLAAAYGGMRRYDDAQELLTGALADARKDLGEDSTLVGLLLTESGSLYQMTGQWNQAVARLEKAADIQRRAIALDRPHASIMELLRSVLTSGEIRRSQGRYGEAETLLEEARQLAAGLAQHFDHCVSDWADVLVQVGLLESDLGRYDDAEQTFLKALDLFQSQAQAPTRGAIEAQLGLAAVFYATARYDEAEERAIQSVQSATELLRDDNPFVATAKVMLADVFYRTGRLADSKVLCEEALAALRLASLDDHPATAIVLHTLAKLHDQMSDYVATKRLCEEALEIMEGAGVANHPNYGMTLGLLASALMALRSPEAPEYSERALATLERAFGPDHPSTAEQMCAAAEVIGASGDDARAEKLLQRSVEIFRSTLGPKSPFLATALCSLGRHYRSAGRYGDSESCLREGLSIQRAVHASNAPEIAGTLHSLTLTVAGAGKPEDAISLMAESLAAEDREVVDVLRFATDKQRRVYLGTLNASSHVLLSLVSPATLCSGESICLGFDTALRRKALDVEVLATRHAAVLDGRYPEHVDTLAEWHGIRNEIAQLQLLGPPPEGVNEHKEVMTQLQEARDEIEGQLARVIREVGLDAQLRAANHASVISALPPGSALLEFVSYFEFDLTPTAVDDDGARRYLAFLTRAGDQAVYAAALGDADEIDALVAAHIFSLSHGEGEARHIGVGMRLAPQPATADAGELAARVFEPFREVIDECSHLFIAPDGDLNRLPFETLPSGNGDLLIDEFTISYLDSARDLLRFGSACAVEADCSIVVADPDFDLGHSRGNGLDRRFARLAGAAWEGEVISERLGVRPLMGEDALEGVIKAARSPALLHLATHGFFERDHDPSSTLSTLDDLIEQDNSLALNSLLLSSGLALAGANAALMGAGLPPEAGDGLLYADEVVGMDLVGTEMVVLSACETGLGKVQIGEGVHGLRRAFVIAGAKTLVMSLWRVPDDQTQELMVNFYDRVLAGEPRSEALREAQLDMRERYDDPYYWAAFICHGDPGPIRTGNVVRNSP